MRRRFALSFSVVILVAGCEPAAAPVTEPVAPAAPRVVFTTTLDRENALVGRIWSVRANAFVDEAQLLGALHGHVLIGEKHDNPDHHALQARLLRAMLERRQRPVVAFEMFDADDQAAIDSSRREHPRDATRPRSPSRCTGRNRGGRRGATTRQSRSWRSTRTCASWRRACRASACAR